MDWKLTAGFSSGSEIDIFFIILILFILFQIAKYT